MRKGSPRQELSMNATHLSLYTIRIGYIDSIGVAYIESSMYDALAARSLVSSSSPTVPATALVALADMPRQISFRYLALQVFLSHTSYSFEVVLLFTSQILATNYHQDASGYRSNVSCPIEREPVVN